MVRFVDVLGKALPKPRLKAIAEAVELNSFEIDVLMLRCAEQRTRGEIEDFHHIPKGRQSEIVRQLNNKVHLWFLSNASFFSSAELTVIDAALVKHNIKPEV